MNVIVLIPDHGRLREAIPVRALPRVAPDRLYAERIARELTQLNQCYGSRILLHVQSYQLTEDGKIIEVLPVQWLRVLTDVLALSQELDDPQHPRLFDKSGLAIPDPQRDSNYDDAVLGRLPKGVFVWWDEFERVYLERLSHWPEQQQRDGQLVRYPLISSELRSVIMEGFERLLTGAEASVAPPLCAEPPAPSDQEPGEPLSAAQASPLPTAPDHQPPVTSNDNLPLPGSGPEPRRRKLQRILAALQTVDCELDLTAMPGVRNDLPDGPQKL